MVLHLCQFYHSAKCLNIFNHHRAAIHSSQIQVALEIYKKGYGYIVLDVPRGHRQHLHQPKFAKENCLYLQEGLAFRGLNGVYT